MCAAVAIIVSASPSPSKNSPISTELLASGSNIDHTASTTLPTPGNKSVINRPKHRGKLKKFHGEYFGRSRYASLPLFGGRWRAGMSVFKKRERKSAKGPRKKRQANTRIRATNREKMQGKVSRTLISARTTSPFSRVPDSSSSKCVNHASLSW